MSRPYCTTCPRPFARWPQHCTILATWPRHIGSIRRWPRHGNRRQPEGAQMRPCRPTAHTPIESALLPRRPRCGRRPDFMGLAFVPEVVKGCTPESFGSCPIWQSLGATVLQWRHPPFPRLNRAGHGLSEGRMLGSAMDSQSPETSRVTPCCQSQHSWIVGPERSAIPSREGRGRGLVEGAGQIRTAREAHGAWEISPCRDWEDIMDSVEGHEIRPRITGGTGKGWGKTTPLDPSDPTPIHGASGGV